MSEEQLTTNIINIFFNWQVLLISFAVFAVLGVVKSIGTKKEGVDIVGGFAQNTYFRTFKPAYPYLLALAFCFIPGVPLPEVVSETVAVKVLYAIYTGWLSDKSYQLIKSVVEKLIKKVG